LSIIFRDPEILKKYSDFTKSFKRCWAEIDLDALESNVRKIKKFCPGKKLIAVIKADAYGHGHVSIFKMLLQIGVSNFAVSNLIEAIELRELNREAKILILGYTDPQYADMLAKYNITQTILNLEHAKALNKNANSPIKCHIAVDTGMGRIGLRYDDSKLDTQISEILLLRNIKATHFFTHLAGADGTDDFSEEYTNFQHSEILRISEKFALPFHCQNSAAATNLKLKGDHIRVGISLYGISPDRKMPLPYELTPVMTLKTIISQVKILKMGDFVSYGMTYKAERPVKVATLTIGYADGYPRALSNKGLVYINGSKCPVIGRVCMDMVMVDITGVHADVGDEAELFGKNILANDLADFADTIGYELVCGISKRVPRIPMRSPSYKV
jgi:alanine racemase